MLRKEKLKEIWNQISHEIRNVIVKYPFTISFIILVTILSVIFIDKTTEFIAKYIMPFLGWFGVGVYLSESGFSLQKKIPIKIAGIVLSGIISAFLVYQYRNYYGNEYYYIPNDIWFARINMAYIIVCLVLGIYFCYRKSGYLLPQYGIRVFSNLVKTHIIYSILSIGALIISIIIQELFFRNSYNLSIIGRMMILVIGLFYVPSFLYSFSETNLKIDAFSKILVKYVLFPLTTLIFIIIYIYVIKMMLGSKAPYSTLKILHKNTFSRLI